VTDLLAVEVGAPPEADQVGTRGRRQSPLWRIFGPIDLGWQILFAVVGVAVVLGGWALAAVSTDNPTLFPTPAAAARALVDLWSDGRLGSAAWASGQRILIGYAISIAVGVVVGIAIGAYAAANAFLEAPIGFLRYIPASALGPVFMIWFGLGESPKIWLVAVGSVFFNVIMIADVVRGVPRELVHAAYTLGAGRWTVLRRVIARHSVPGIIDAARVNLAAAWLMLVVAELLAADAGLGVSIVQLNRFRAVDGMFAVLFTFGVIGLVSDVLLRWLRNRLSPWARA
jgi:NitT/TauT family transport system permease protein